MQFQDGGYTAVGLTSPELSYIVAVLEFLGIIYAYLELCVGSIRMQGRPWVCRD